MMTEKQYTIGEISAETGLTRRALRLYEQAGLLKPIRGENNYRLYSEADKQRAEVVQDLRQAGLGLDVIRQIFAVKQGVLSQGERLAQTIDILKSARAELQETRSKIENALAYIDDELHSLESYQANLQEERDTI